MSKAEKSIEIKVERVIPAAAKDVFDAWLDSTIPGTTWNAADKFIMDPKEDALFFWSLKNTAHYGRFTRIERPICIQHTWMSPNTLGQESKVTVTFEPRGDDTLMTIVHSELPDCEPAKAHERGWNYFMSVFFEQFGNGSRKAFSWAESHPDGKRGCNE